MSHMPGITGRTRFLLHQINIINVNIATLNPRLWPLQSPLS
jgi:hypothetical protein